LSPDRFAEAAMQPDDVFRRQFDGTIAALARFADAHRDVAAVTTETTPHYWYLALAPFAPTACPVELVLHRTQTFDIMIATESYDGQPARPLDALEPLLSAIVSGRVVQRTYRAAASARHLGRVTQVAPAGSPLVLFGAAEVPDGLDATIAEKHFAPYRR
jgi:hypothetical protein